MTQSKRGFIGSVSALPFLVEVNGGLGEVHGTATCEESILSISYETRDSVSGLFRKESELHLPLTEIERVSFRRGWLFSRVTVMAASIDAIRSIKWRSGYRFHLGIRRSDRSTALAFVDSVQWLIDNPDTGQGTGPSSQEQSEK